MKSNSSTSASEVNYFRIITGVTSDQQTVDPGLTSEAAQQKRPGSPSLIRSPPERTIKNFALSCLVEPLRFHFSDEIMTQPLTIENCVQTLQAMRRAELTAEEAEDAPPPSQQEKDEDFRFANVLKVLLEDRMDEGGSAPYPDRQKDNSSPQEMVSGSVLAGVPSLAGGHVMPMDVEEEDALPQCLSGSHDVKSSSSTPPRPSTMANRVQHIINDSPIKDGIIPYTVTAREALNYTTPAFPATSQGERDILFQVLVDGRKRQAHLIRKREVLDALSKNTGSFDTHMESIAENLFAMGSDYLLIEAYADLIRGLGSHSVKDDFLSYSATESLRDKSLMAGFLPTLIVVIVVIVTLVSLDMRTLFIFTRTVEWPTTDDWINFCPSGVQEPCFFSKRNILDMGTPAMTLQYYRAELVEHLWVWNTNQRPLLDGTWGGAWLIGGLLLRMSSIENSPTADEFLEMRCEDMNLTSSYWDRKLAINFDCNAFTHAFVPFSATKQEALDALVDFQIEIPVVENAALIANFGAFRPTDGTYLWATVATVIPVSGSVWPRSKMRPYRVGDDTRILPIMILQLIATLYHCITAVVVGDLQAGMAKSKLKCLLSVQTIWGVLLSALVIASYAHLVLVEAPVGVLQSSHMPIGMDAAAENYDTGMRLFGVYVLMLLLSLMLFVGQIDDLRFLKELVAACIRDLVGMLVVFALVLFGFAMIGVAIFGNFVPAFSNGINAIIAVVQYLLGRGDLNEISENYIIFSVAYFVSLKLFVTFFVLNLIIAVVTAPLSEIRDELNLYTQLAEGTRRRHALTASREKLPKWKSLMLSVRLSMLSTLNTLRDIVRIPILPSELEWQTVVHKLVHSGESCYTFSDTLGAVEFLLDTLDHHPAGKWWESALVDEVEVQIGGYQRTRSGADAETIDEGEYDEMVPYVLPLLQLQIQSGSRFDILRDAWLSRVLAVFDTFSTRRTRLADQHEAERRRNQTHAETLHTRTVRAAAMQATKGKSTAAAEAADFIASPTISQLDPVTGDEVKPTDVKKKRNKFAFTFFVEKRLYSSIMDVVAATATIILFLVFAFSLMSGNTSTSYLTANLHKGLRDQFYDQRCFDANCVTAFTQKKTFRDIGHLNDVIQYMQFLYIPQVFPTTLTYEVPVEDYTEEFLNSTHAVAWDNYLRRLGNVSIRQVRAKRSDCNLPNREQEEERGADAARLDAVYSTQCYSLTNPPFDEDDMVRPSDSPLPPEAYQFRQDCAEENNEFVVGDLNWYPCSGYSTTFNTAEDMTYALTKWVDGGTRLIVLTLTVVLDEDTAQYNQYFEMGDSGGTTVAWTRVFPLSDRELMVSRNIAVIVLISIDTVLFIVLLIRNWCSKIRPPLRDVTRPEIPIVNIIVIILVIAFAVSPLTKIIRRVLIDVLILVWLIFKTLTYAMFPVAELFSRHVTVVRRTFALALVALVTMLAFFMVSFAAFLLSGQVLFGRSILNFGSIQQGALNVMAYFLGSLDVDPLYLSNERIAYVYILVVFAVTVLLSNLVLTLIVSAAETARQEVGNTAFLEKLAPHLGTQVFGGPLIRFLVLCSVWWLHLAAATEGANEKTEEQLAEEQEAEDRRPASQEERIVTTFRGRLPTASECLQSWFGPYRLNEVNELLQLHNQPRWLALSGAALLIGEITNFEEEYPVATWQDHGLEAYESAKRLHQAEI